MEETFFGFIVGEEEDQNKEEDKNEEDKNEEDKEEKIL